MINRLLIIYLLATALFLCLSFFLQLPADFQKADFVFPDVDTYIQSANLLYNYDFTPHHMRPWGYAAILGLPYLFNSDASIYTLLTWSVIINSLAWMGSIYLTYKIAEQWWGRKTAFFVSCSFLLIVSNIPMIYQAMTETIIIFLLLLMVYNIRLYLRMRKPVQLLTALFSICLMAIIRPSNYLLCLPALSIALWLFRKRTIYLLSSLLIFIFTVGLQVFLMNKEYGIKKVSMIANYTLYHYLGARVEMAEEWAFDYAKVFERREGIAYQQALTDSMENEKNNLHFYLNKAYADGIKHQLRTNPAGVFTALTQNIISNATDGNSIIAYTRNTKEEKQGILLEGLWLLTIAENVLFSALCIINSIIVSWLCIKSHFRLSEDLLFACVLQCLSLYYFITSGVSFWQGDRFHFIWYPLMILLTVFTFKAIRRHTHPTGLMRTLHH